MSDTSAGPFITQMITRSAASDMSDEEAMRIGQRNISATGAFFRGFGSSLLTSVLMMGVIAGVAGLVVLAAPASLTAVGATGFMASIAGAAKGVLSMYFVGSATLLSIGAGLFGGVMAAKHALFNQTVEEREPNFIPVPVQGMAAPAMPPTIAQDVAPEVTSESPTPNSNWRETVNRSGDTQSRIQQIIDNRSMSDKDRASALLAVREAEAATPAQSARA